MSNQWPSPLFVSIGSSTDWTVATPVGIPEFITPIPALNVEYIFTQKYWQFRANFTPIAFNTPHPSSGLTPDYSSYFLVAESKRRDIGFGVVEWERTYAKKPATYSEAQSHDYNFIGYMGQWISTTSSGFTNNVPPAIIASVTGRPRESYVVTSRLQYDYYLVAGPLYQGAWSSSTAYTLGQSVVDSAIYYACTAAIGPTATHPASDSSHWVVIATPDYSAETGIPIVYAQRYYANGGTLINGLYTNFLTDGVGTIGATTPSLTTYTGWVSNTNTYGWSSDVIGGTHPAQIVAEDSHLIRWQGNIWSRMTRYVLAL